MKIVVTGGAGAIGEYVVERLKSRHDIVIIDNSRPQRNTEVEFKQVDLLNMEEAETAIDDDTDTVVHLAAIPRPSKVHSESLVMRVNMVITYNILEIIRKKKIKRIIFGSSDSGTGFGIRRVMHKPLYLPIDSRHPCWPHEAYGFTKHFGEIMCAEYSRAYGIETVTVRFMWVWLELFHNVISRILKGEAKDPLKGFGSYVMPRDVAQIIDLAIEYRMDGSNLFPFEIFFAHAAETFLPIETLQQASKIWPEMPLIKKPEYYQKNPKAPFFDMTDTYAKLGYKPEYSYQDLIKSA